MRMYLEDMDITSDDLDAQMDWDSFASNVLIRWTQTGHKDGSPGSLRFDSDSGLFSVSLTLEYRDGLYYCPTDAFTVA